MVREVAETVLGKHVSNLFYAVLGVLLWWGFSEIQQNNVALAVVAQNVASLEKALDERTIERNTRLADIEARLRLIEKHVAVVENGKVRIDGSR